MTQFFVLRPVEHYFSLKWAYGEKQPPINLGEVDRCPVCGGAVSLKHWQPPYRVKLSSAKPEKWGDFLWVGGTSLAISSRLKEIYNKENLRGIQSFGGPLEIVRYGTKKTGNFPVSPPTYFVIQVPWGGANQNDVASGVTHQYPEKIKCLYCREGASGRKQEKISIANQTWNGDDIFRPRGAPVQYLITERFKEICEMYQVTNVQLIPAEKYGYDEQRLTNWYIHD